MINWQIEKFASVESTMDIAHDRAGNGCAEGRVIVADEQTRGHGRRGNAWVSPVGNLYCSIILRPELAIRNSGQISFLTAVVLADTVMPMLSDDHIYQNKWPNDSLIDGRKFAGILLENGTSGHQLDYLIIGIGVNIVTAPQDKIDLASVVKNPIGKDEFLNALTLNFTMRLDQWRKHGFAPIRQAWLTHAKGLGGDIQVRLPQGDLGGKFNGLDENGALLLGLDQGLEKVIHSGEVFFGPMN